MTDVHTLLSPVTDETVRRELPRALSALPPWRLQKALSYRCDTDRYTCAKAWLLLCGLLSEHYGITSVPEPCCGPFGKPFLKDFPQVHFSISHCRRAVLCAVCDAPVGVDVEELQYDPSLARAVLSEAELSQLLACPDPRLCFTELWTRKESLLKLEGTGLSGPDLRSLLERKGSGVDLRTRSDPAAGIAWSIATLQQ